MFYRDSIEKDQILYYTVQLVDLFRPVPGKKWETDEGITIEVRRYLIVEITLICKTWKSGESVVGLQ